jgi:DNA polymerase-1
VRYAGSGYLRGGPVWDRGLIGTRPWGFLNWPQTLQQIPSGDPYLAFAKQSGAVPADATKQSHKRERDMFKTVVLGVGYGMEADALAGRLGISTIEARELLRKHKETYPRFWHWSQNVVDAALSSLSIQTVFGWRLCTKADGNPRSVRNFPMQANGAEMLRIACCLGTERGIRICAPVHDAILIEAPAEEIEASVATMQGYMRAASRIVLGGFELRTDAEITRYPERYNDPRGAVMWERVMRLIAEREAERVVE